MAQRRTYRLIILPLYPAAGSSDAHNLRAAIRGLSGRAWLADGGRIFSIDAGWLRRQYYGICPISRRFVRRLRDSFYDYRKSRLRALERERAHFEAWYENELAALQWAKVHVDELNRRLDDGTFGQNPK